jgi:D-alanine-D-alanine ligase
MTRVAVLMGGWSAEREVSLSSGRESAAVLKALGYDVRAISAR